MTWIMSKLRSWLGWPQGSKTTSRVLVSVYVQNAMHPRGLSSRSRRILLTTSIWSLIVLVFVFFITYTVLLVCVDRPFHSESGSSDELFSHASRPRIRFHGRGTSRKFAKQDDSLLFHSGSMHNKKLWDASLYDGPSSSLPECKRGSLFVIIITSAPDHFEHRREIRNTWCNPEVSNHEANVWQCVFLIGKVSDTEKVADFSSQEHSPPRAELNNLHDQKQTLSGAELKVREESERYKDILQGSYIDSYRNLTHKVMHGLSWVSTKCSAPYIVKTDDDCFVNTHLFWQFLMHYNKQTNDLYAGHMVLDPKRRHVIRDPSQKWSVSKEEYSPESYPVYASGSGYTLSYDVLLKAVEESKYVRPIPNEDAYMGILMEKLGIQPTSSGRFILSSAGLRLCNYLYMFVVHDVQPHMHKEMHKNAMLSQKQCKDEDEVVDWY